MTRLKSALASTLAAAALLAAVPAAAQNLPDSLHAGVLEVPINKSQVVTADRPISKALVGSPAIADVLPISERSVYVLGKAMGTTSLTMYDRLNRVIAVMDIEVGPDVMGLQAQLRQLVPNEAIDARLSNGSIILTGMVNGVGPADRAAMLAKAYAGEKVINLISLGSSQQVMLEVRFAEVNRQIGERLAMRHFMQSADGTFSGAIGPGAALDSTNGLSTSGVVDAFGIFTKSFSIGSLDISSTLDSLEKRGLSKTLAEPTLLAISGEKASFLAGGEFPIPVSQGSGTTGGGNGNAITVEFKPFGVSLAFTPTVLGDKVISMVVEPEVSSIDPTASITINGLNIPGLQTRRASTTVELRDGESFAIAGLLRQDFQTTVNQLPLLGSIPIIGALFRSSDFRKGQTELMIVVTPRLVAPLKPQQVRLPTDRIDDPKAVDVLLDGEGYRPRKLDPVPGPGPVSNAAPATPAAPPQAAARQAAGPAPAATSAKETGYAY